MATRVATSQGWRRQEINSNWRDDVGKYPWEPIGAPPSRTAARSTSHDQFNSPPPFALLRRPNFKPPPGGAETLWHMANPPPLPMSTSLSAFQQHTSAMPHRFRPPSGSAPYASTMDAHSALLRSTSSDAFSQNVFRAPPQPCPPPVNPPLFSSADAQGGVIIRSNSTDSFQAHPSTMARQPSCRPPVNKNAPFTSGEDDQLPRSTSKEAYQYMAYRAPPRRFRPKVRERRHLS